MICSPFIDFTYAIYCIFVKNQALQRIQLNFGKKTLLVVHGLLKVVYFANVTCCMDFSRLLCEVCLLYVYCLVFAYYKGQLMFRKIFLLLLGDNIAPNLN